MLVTSSFNSAVDILENYHSPSKLSLVFSISPSAAIVLVGPEGDFSAEETTAALTAGFVPVSLGTIVLRVETASLFCLSALRYEFAT